MSGFEYDKHASVSYTDYYPSLSGNYIGVLANYGMKIKNNHGVGINYNGDFLPYNNSNRVNVNYNYQFNFDKAGKLALGTGVGFGRYEWNDDFPYYYYDSTTPIVNNQFEINLGVAYQWKRLIVGFSTTNLNVSKQDLTNSHNTPLVGYIAHAQYNFSLSRKFQLIPRLLYSTYHGFSELSANLSVTYLDQFSLGVSSRNRDQFGVNVGWDIKNKFRVAYMFSQTISKLNNSASGGIHEISIGYILKKRKLNPITPQF